MKINVVPIGDGEPRIAVIAVTPEMAERWLGKNLNNRNIRKPVYAGYARDMKAGRWMLNGETIKFADDGTLLDGQHRLHAVIAAGVNAGDRDSDRRQRMADNPGYRSVRAATERASPVGDLNNPASRLEHQLRTLEAMAKGKDQVPVYQMLCEIWGLDSETLGGRAEYMRRVALLMDLSAEVRAIAATIEPMGVSALEQYHQIEKIVRAFLMHNQKAVALLGQIDPAGWWSLSLLSTAIAQQGRPHELDEETQQSLVDQTRALIDQVIAADDIPVDEKHDLVNRLRDVEEVLLRAQIAPEDELRGAVDGLFGCMVRLWVRGSAVANHPVVDGAFKLIGAIGIVLGYGADVASLADGGFNTLRELGPGA